MSVAYDTFDRNGTLAVRLDAELRRAHPRTILEAAVESFGDKLALVSSFGAESAVLLHLAAQVKPDIPVLFLDTGMLFGQTLDYRQQLAARLGLTNVRDLRPQYHDLATGDPQAKLWQTDTDACCNIRKVLPLDRALGEFDAWITGRKPLLGGRAVRGLEGVEAAADHRTRLLAQDVAHGADFAVVAIAVTQEAGGRIAAAVAVFGEGDGDEREMRQVVGDVLHRLAGLNEHADRATGVDQRLADLPELGQRQDHAAGRGHALLLRRHDEGVVGEVSIAAVQLNELRHRRPP